MTNKQNEPNHFDPLLAFDIEMKSISEYYNIPKEHILLKSRKREIVDARHCLAVIMLRGMSTVRIAKILGYKDHTTITHSKKKIKDMYDTDSNFKTFFNILSNHHPFEKLIVPSYPLRFTSLAFR